MDQKLDTCGIPNRANFHVHVVISRVISEVPYGTETSDVDIYVCEAHIPALLDEGQLTGQTVTHSAESDIWASVWDTYKLNVRKLFNFDNHEEWDILEVSVSRLR